MKRGRTCSLRINRFGYAYLPKYLGPVRAKWVRRGGGVVLTLWPRPRGEAGATQYVLPPSLMGRLLCSRPCGYVRAVFRRNKENGLWVARIGIHKRCLE
jgi:hypothetical protein